MKAIPINVEGIQFRSKIEARRYLFMRNLGWNVEYEPEIEGIFGWIPDFLIMGNGTKVLMEVKPFATLIDFETDYAAETVKKIQNSLKDVKVDAVLLVGSSLNLGKAECGGEHSFVGGKIIRPNTSDFFPEKFYTDNFAYTDRPGGRFEIGVCDEIHWYHDVINNDHNGGYSLEKNNYNLVNRCWNEAGSQLQWKAPRDKFYDDENEME